MQLNLCDSKVAFSKIDFEKPQSAQSFSYDQDSELVNNVGRLSRGAFIGAGPYLATKRTIKQGCKGFSPLLSASRQGDIPFKLICHTKFPTSLKASVRLPLSACEACHQQQTCSTFRFMPPGLDSDA